MVFRLEGHDRPARVAALLLAIASIAAILASPARANLGYELDSSNPSRDLGGAPRGIAIDQASQDIYAAIVSTNFLGGAAGEIERFHGNLTANGVFAKGGGYYTGVAVNPLTHDFYAARTRIETNVGTFGTPGLDRFSSSGTAAGSYALDDTEGIPPMAVDSGGNLFYPNAAEHAVLVFNASGVLQKEILCTGCPGGSFGKPVSVAIGSGDDLYVADLAPDRVIKLTLSGGSYSFASLFQSGRGAAAVGVDPASGDVLVGDIPGGTHYHIVAYDSSGIQFDDFGAGLFPDPLPGFGAFAAYQMAVNETTHKLYVGADEKFYIFEKVTSHLPTASSKPSANVGQITATLNATVNAMGHAVLTCNFELTESADVSFASATPLPCPENPDGSNDTVLALKVSVLSPFTAYRYRVTAASNAGSVSSDSQTFETLPEVPPTVTPEPPAAVTQTTATLNGKVNPHGGSVTNCHFEYGTSASYGSSVSCASLPGPVTSDVAEARALSGLTPGTAYHYRLVITSNAGTTEGDDVAFATASPPSEPAPETPSSPNEPAAPPVTTPPPIVPSHPLHCRKGFRKRKVQGKLRCVKRKRPSKHTRRHRGHR